MIALVLAMLVCVALGGLVVGFVAVEARRDGRELFTAEGEEILAGAKRRGEDLREQGAQLTRKSLASINRR